MKRIFSIRIFLDFYAWDIHHENYKGTYGDEDGAESPDSIGICVKDKNGLIYLYDPFCPDDETIKESKHFQLFQEICVFNHLGHIFQGTFTDALIYIQNLYRQDQYEKNI
jgi:hypothetical protein